MRAIRLPGPTLGTPFGTAINFAHEDILAIKSLESRAVRVQVRRYPWLRFDIPPTCLLLPLLALFFDRFSLGREGDETGIKLNGKKCSEVRCES